MDARQEPDDCGGSAAQLPKPLQSQVGAAPGVRVLDLAPLLLLLLLLLLQLFLESLAVAPSPLPLCLPACVLPCTACSACRYGRNWLKLRALTLTQYDSVLLIDSDVVVLGDVTPLFSLPVEFAASWDQSRWLGK